MRFGRIVVTHERFDAVRRGETMLVYGHRGLSGHSPENTLLAFREAIAAGVDGLEFDVHATSDGVPVIIHDRSLERTTNGTGYVDEARLARLRELDAGRGERVPTLDEVLNLVGDQVHLDIEVKQSGIEEATLHVLSAHPNTRWAISSFDWDTLRTLRALDGNAELWPLAEHWSDEVVAVARELGSPIVALFTGAYTPIAAAELREAGLSAMVWTVNDEGEARRVNGLGAAALCTDYADRIIPIVRWT
jgi:glycerophosphoryl diester phosphodiesterase